MPIATYKDLCIDAVDPAAQGAFWGLLLGWRAETMDNGDCCLREAGDQNRVQVWINGVPSRWPERTGCIWTSTPTPCRTCWTPAAR
jgi:hypothetical protein